MGKKEFAAAAVDLEHMIYIVHVGSVNSNALPSFSPFDVHPFRSSQISGLIAEEAPIKIPAKYLNFANVFFPDLAFELPKHTRINDHAINLVEGCQQPPYRPIYSLGPVELETLKTYIETNLANGFIRPSKSPASAPILFDQKSNGSFCLCVNYRGLNNFTIKNRYPLPLIGESLNRLGRAKQFTQLDLTSTYYRMRICKGDKWKTAFRTWYGHFKYQMMPFGLTNAPASFQRYINKIFAEKLDIFVIVYLDDIFIYTDDDGNGHIAAVRWVLEQLRKFLLYANLKNCQFHQEEVWFLGYMVSLKSIRMEDEKIEAVKQWPELQSVQDIQVFLGFANFYRQFIQEFSQIAVPLTSMLKTSSTKSAEPRMGVVGVGGGSKARCNRGGLDGSGIDNVEVDSDKVEVEEKGRNLFKSKKTESGFLTSGAIKAFTE